MMSYRSVSPHLKSSCYNCRYFQTGGDMLNGLCFYKSTEGQAAIGIGTCSHFTMKGGSDFAWQGVACRPGGDIRQVTAIR